MHYPKYSELTSVSFLLVSNSISPQLKSLSIIYFAIKIPSNLQLKKSYVIPYGVLRVEYLSPTYKFQNISSLFILILNIVTVWNDL